MIWSYDARKHKRKIKIYDFRIAVSGLKYFLSSIEIILTFKKLILFVGFGWGEQTQSLWYCDH